MSRPLGEFLALLRQRDALDLCLELGSRQKSDNKAR
jgi:hypothetical protein